jgi:hypothetical protein
MPGHGDRVDARAPEPLPLGRARGWTTTKPHDDRLDGARQVVDPPPGPARQALSRSAAAFARPPRWPARPTGPTSRADALSLAARSTGDGLQQAPGRPGAPLGPVRPGLPARDIRPDPHRSRARSEALAREPRPAGRGRLRGGRRRAVGPPGGLPTWRDAARRDQGPSKATRGVVRHRDLASTTVSTRARLEDSSNWRHVTPILRTRATALRVSATPEPSRFACT